MSGFSRTAQPPVVSGPRTRAGRVTLDGRVLRDDGGPFLALGATLFWALWGERHDPDRLDENLAWLAAAGVDYIRILGMVGGEGWRDRAIDPAAADYWTIVDRLVARLAKHHLRAQITVFAGAHVMMSDPAARRAFVDRWAERLNRDPERFVLVEIANEHYQNGLDDVRELRALGSRLAARTPVLVALSAPAGEACAVYAGSDADVATIHYPRDFEGDGPWRAVSRPWEFPAHYDAGCRGRLPPAINNEPIGPGSSVRDDADPLRLVMAFIMTFLSGNAAYVVHAGAGVRGGGEADNALGRPANLFDVPGLGAALDAMRAARAYLPADLPNWSKVDAADPAYPLPGTSGDALFGAYAAVHQERFFGVLLGVRRPLEVTTRRPVTVEVVDPLTGSVRGRSSSRIDGTLRIEPVPRDRWGDGIVVVGR